MALKNAFRSKGIECEIIDYRNARFERQYGLQTKFGTANFLKKKCSFCLEELFLFAKEEKIY